MPKPAGAEIRVSVVSRPRWSRSMRRGRSTAPLRGLGTYSFVSSSGRYVSTVMSPWAWYPEAGAQYHRGCQGHSLRSARDDEFVHLETQVPEPAADHVPTRTSSSTSRSTSLRSGSKSSRAADPNTKSTRGRFARRRPAMRATQTLDDLFAADLAAIRERFEALRSQGRAWATARWRRSCASYGPIVAVELHVARGFSSPLRGWPTSRRPGPARR